MERDKETERERERDWLETLDDCLTRRIMVEEAAWSEWNNNIIEFVRVRVIGNPMAACLSNIIII